MIVGLDECIEVQSDSAVFLFDKIPLNVFIMTITVTPLGALQRFPVESIEGHPNIEIRYDLIDCSIDVCAVEASHRRSRDTSR